MINKPTGNQVHLFGYFRSSASWRLRIALNLKNIEYNYTPINLLENKQNSEEYKLLNPSGLVPTLYIDGNLFSESLSICEYLEETRPNNNLLPKDAAIKAKIRAFCEVINSGIQPLHNLRVLKKVESLNYDKLKWAKEMNITGLNTIEQLLEKTKGKYCFGDTITLADVFLYPQAHSAFNRFKVDSNDYKNIREVFDNLSTVKEFIDALPENQIDYK